MTDEQAADFTALLDFLNDTSSQLRTFSSELTNTQLRVQDPPGEFSVLENVCHLRDLELQGYTVRIKRMLGENEPELADFDGARVAAESDYNNERLDVALDAFQKARTENLTKLRNLTTAELENGGSLEGVGRITLRRLAEMMREHDEGHLDDLRVLSQRLKRRVEAASS
jgi:hypothetical protein